MHFILTQREKVLSGASSSTYDTSLTGPEPHPYDVIQP